ncbi:hypothetical protein GA0061105_1054 [Rhizobium aethiopicum]|uniref:Uncharacterized protein n=1 Tax=Rhizobium aethiopicum TaxID=1138170 RepID=A0A1C3Y251_9HYPH|nr:MULTISPECIES: hypothetical protein [Rhizobium]SCB58537.1 hypothetical protein GA0061105_1054 [Rhizobium aethiopicum]
MARPVAVNDLNPRLRDRREPIIDFVCRPCGRHCTLERSLLVKTFGAGVTFAILRRRMAMGCERMQAPEGDKCGAHFPCLKDTVLMEAGP